MKTIRIFITISGLFFTILAAANERTEPNVRAKYPDSLVLTTDAKNDVIFMFHKMGSNQNYFANEQWKSMISVMETAVERSDKSEGISVTYQVIEADGQKSVEISVKELKVAESVFVISKDNMKEKLSSRIEFLILQPDVAVSFSVETKEELDEIKELDVASIWSQVKEKYDHQGNNVLYKGAGTIKYSQVSLDKIDNYQLTIDRMELTFVGVGLGYYRDRFVPDIGSKVTFKMHNRLGREWLDFGLLYTNQFFYSRNESGEYNLDTNGWLTGFTKFYSSNGSQVGIGIGGLIHKKGDFYEGATFKLSLGFNKANARLTYSPELVFTDSFKDFFPAIRIGLSF